MTQTELIKHLESLYPDKIRARSARYVQIQVEEFARDGDGYGIYVDTSRVPGMVFVTDGGSTGMRMWTDEMETAFKATAGAICSAHGVEYYKGEIHKLAPLENIPETVHQVLAAMKELDP